MDDDPLADLTASGGAEHLAIMVPGVGAYLSGNPTVAHTWCPTGTVGNYASMVFYPQGDSVAEENDVLAATTDGQHILGTTYAGGGVTLNDLSVSIPITTSPSGVATPAECSVSSAGVLSPLTIAHTVNAPQALNISATSVNQILTSPAGVAQGSTAAATNLSFITYNGTTPGATLPYYTQAIGSPRAGNCRVPEPDRSVVHHCSGSGSLQP